MIKSEKYFSFFPNTSNLILEVNERGTDLYKSENNIQCLTDLVNQAFQKEYSKYLKTGEYYPGCNLNTYQLFYKPRLKQFLGSNKLNELHFIQSELITLKRIGFHEDYYNFLPELYSKPYKENLIQSCKKTREFLYSKVLEDLNGRLVLNPEYYEIYHLSNTPKELKELAFWNFDVTTSPDTGEEAKNQPRDSFISLSALETAYLAYYLIKSKEYDLINNPPGEMDWKHFSEMTNGKSPTNIRKSYNEINLRDDERLKPSRTPKIFKVISFLKEQFPQYKLAIQKAEQELHIVQEKLN